MGFAPQYESIQKLDIVEAPHLICEEVSIVSKERGVRYGGPFASRDKEKL